MFRRLNASPSGNPYMHITLVSQMLLDKIGLNILCICWLHALYIGVSPSRFRSKTKTCRRKYYILINIFKCKYFVSNLTYIPAHGMNNFKLPGIRFCLRGNKPWDCMQCYNFLPDWARTDFTQRCTKGLKRCLFGLHAGDPPPPYSHGDIQRDSPIKHVQTRLSDC
jgi:hypothetical protein